MIWEIDIPLVEESFKYLGLSVSMRNGTDSIDSLNNPAQDIRYVNNAEYEPKKKQPQVQ
jgi:hypothetical protein